ncbi:ABC transporter ATP-binding protein [Candidatus Solirubrobacter pratensis]|uniref:ABC transporter ATP-binding protein n=1 Tax=Candidatus Solirubrobacter pratensis TaxID=1298857 RepID=UPI00068612A2|nr:ABC transporter ATP-binding protein [Candidatus Solirubrobacter pratensis]
MSAPAIVVDGVSKHFRRPHEQMHTFKERALHPFRRRSHDEFVAVRGASFTVERGEFFGIVGRNGSGKSTLLKLIAGIYKTDGGEIWVNGRMSTFIELGVGFNPDLAARDNVILNGIMLGLTPGEARARYERVIDFAELREFENLKLKNYSSGMHVRLAFAVMVQVDADVLLVDEVLAVGDASFQQKCFDEFNRLRDEGKTIILVTHDMSAVRRFAHRAMLMERGDVVTVGDPELVGNQYLQMNFNRDTGSGTPAPTLRFGNGRAQITDIWIEDAGGNTTNAIPHGEEMTVRALIDFRERMEHPTVGLAVETHEQGTAFATSTLWADEYTGVFEAGESATLTVRFRNVLSPGHFYLSPSVSSRGGLELADHRPRTLPFYSTGTLSTGGFVDLDHELRLEHGVTARPAAEIAS